MSHSKWPQVVQHGAALLNGAMTFLVLKAMASLLPSVEKFSQFSSVFLVLAFYLTFIDLGSQSEYLRIFRERGQHHRPSLRIIAQMRLAFALFALFIALGQALFAQLSFETTLSLLLYVASLVPLLILAMWDTYWYASAQLARAIALRLVRILASLAIVLPFMLRPDVQMWQAYALFFGVCSSAALLLLAWQAEFRHALQLRLWLRWSWDLESRAVWSSALKTGSIVAVSSLAWLSFQALALRLVGEQNFAFVNTSMALATPFVLYFQTYIAIKMPEISHWTIHEPQLYLSKVRGLILHLLLAGAGALVSLYLLEQAGVLLLLFGDSAPPSSLYWVSYILSQCLAQISSCFSLYKVFAKQQLWLSKAFAYSIFLGAPFLYLSIEHWGDLGFLFFQLLYWLCILFLAAFHVTRLLRRG